MVEYLTQSWCRLRKFVFAHIVAHIYSSVCGKQLLGNVIRLLLWSVELLFVTRQKNFL